MVSTASLLSARHLKGRLWRTSLQVRLLCPWARRLTRRFYVYVKDRWPSFPSEEAWWQERYPTVKTKMP